MEKLRILFIEDNPEDVELASFLLKKELDRPIEIRTAETKEEFFNIATSFHPHIILSDVNLPLYSGSEALKDSINAFPEIPFIMVTGTMSEEVAADFIKSGAWDYVMKERLIRLVTAVKSSLTLKAVRAKQAATLEKLRVSEERFTLAMKGTQDAIWDWDLETGKQYFSGRWNEMRGYEYSETIIDRKDLLELIHSEDRENVIKELRKHFSLKSDHFYAEYRVKSKNGSYKWILSRGKAMIDKSGKSYRMSGSHTDISERKATEIKLKTLSRALYNAPVSVVITNDSGIIEYVNPKFSEITGYLLEEALGQTTKMLNSGLQSDEFYNELWETILSGREWKGTFVNRKKSGELFWEGASISSITGGDNKISHFIAIKEDITLQRKRNEELVKAKEKAEESDRLKSSFLANMSHEIRTPMNGIIGFADLITKNDLTQEKKHYYADIIKSSTSRLLRLLTDIIDYSKIEAGLIEIHKFPFNMNLLVDQVISESKMNVQLTAIKELEIVAKKALSNDLAVFISDEIRLKQILLNLINNALKFTPKGYIEVGYKDSGDDGLTFYVKDTGMGIDKEMQSIIFERFRQVDETKNRPFEGSGLGLSITKGLVEMLGGKIWLESVVGKGSTFYVLIPRSETELSQDESTAVFVEDTFDIDDLKILVVEDDPVNQQLLEEYFEGYSTNILYAGDGREALEIFNQSPDLDLVLMDIKLPGMSGLEVTKQIKEINPLVKVIAQTAYAMSKDKKKYTEEGCDGYIEKPYDSIKLFQEIQKVYNPQALLR